MITASAQAVLYRGMPLGRMSEEQLRRALDEVRRRNAPMRVIGSVEARGPRDALREKDGD